jgi:N,N'-diacetyllegionaminate synthase
MKHKTLVIAEAGVNHNGDLSLAKELVAAAAGAGADLIKFQTFNASQLVTPAASKAVYQSNKTNREESQYAMLSRLELTEQMHHSLIEQCALRNIGFFSTAFDTNSANFLASIGQTFFKIPSGEINNLPYLKHVGHLAGQVFLSTGMAKLGEIEDAIDILVKSGVSRSHITVLHCTTEYPAPISEVNLKAMRSIQKAFRVPVGYSDHTQGIEVAIAAVALGATVIEKHFTLDRNLPGPDHKASLEPNELKAMVTSIRNIELALGDGIKRLTPSEQRNKPVIRKSLVARVSIAAGEKFSEANIAVKRPGNGISPMRFDEFIGKRAMRDYLPDEQIEN